jgi:hypothetical protein
MNIWKRLSRLEVVEISHGIEIKELKEELKEAQQAIKVLTDIIKGSIGQHQGIEDHYRAIFPEESKKR